MWLPNQTSNNITKIFVLIQTAFDYSRHESTYLQIGLFFQHLLIFPVC